MSRLGLRFRIMILVDLVLLLTIVLTVAAMTFQVNRGLREQLEREAHTTVHLLSQSIGSALYLLDQVEVALGEQMVVQGRIVAYLIAVAEQAGMTPDEINAILRDVAEYSTVDEFRITDESARAYLTNTGVDFTFSPSPFEQPQASHFFQLLNQQNGSVVQDARPRKSDGLVFKYAGVSGVDRPRIVQVGYHARLLAELGHIYSVQGLADDTVSKPDVFLVRRVDTDMREEALSQDENVPEIPDSGERDKENAAEAMTSSQVVSRWESEALVVTAPIMTKGEGGPVVAGAVTVYFSLENMQRMQRRAVTGGLALGLLLCGLGGLISYWLTGRIVQPLQEMAQLAQEVADGDLSQRIEVRHVAELGQVESTLAQMTGQLRATIQRIRESAGGVSASSSDIEAVVGELNETVHQQSAAVAETMAAMQELETTAGQIADDTEKVEGLAARTQGDVQAGLHAVGETVARMDEIRTGNETSVEEILILGNKAQQIGAVMDLIDGFAAETKLIAINASIEAAAAGDAGQRFGVVAEEVQTLAEKVAQSTGDIRQRIREIQTATNELTIAAEQNTKKIDQGVTLSRTAQEALDQIAASAGQTSSSAQQISSSTRQQKTAVGEVGAALRDLNAQVQRVAANSNQTAQVVTDLGRLARTLNELVALFELGD